MDVAALPVLERLLDEMPPVARRVNRDIAGAAPDTSLEDGLQCGEVIVVRREAEVIDKQDELQRVRRELIHEIRDLVELVLLHLDEAQAPRRILVRDRLDGTRLAGARIAVQQHIVRRTSIQQRLGVRDDLLTLLLVARQLGKPLRIRMLHRHQPAILHHEDVVPREHAVAPRADLLHALRILRRQCARLGDPRDKVVRRGTHLGRQLFQGQRRQLVQQCQLPLQTVTEDGTELAVGLSPHADVLTLQHCGAEVLRPVLRLLKQPVLERRTGRGEGIAVVQLRARQHPLKRRDHRILQQFTEHHETA